MSEHLATYRVNSSSMDVVKNRIDVHFEKGRLYTGIVFAFLKPAVSLPIFRMHFLR